jgi:hypothetical protein
VLVVDAYTGAKVFWGDPRPQARRVADRCRRIAPNLPAAGPRSRRERAYLSIGEGRMYYDEESGAVNFLAGLLMGAVLGATAALLAAPQSGKRMRRKLIRAVSTGGKDAAGRFGDLTDEVRSAVNAGRRRVRI